MTRPILVLLLLLPAALAAQVVPDSGIPVPPPRSERGWAVGVTGFTGGDYQPSGLEVGLVRSLGRGRAQNVYGLIRLGSFVQDQSVLIGHTTGFFLSALFGVRTSLATLAEIGAEGEPSQYVRVVGLLEAGPEFNVHSPLPQGRWMALVAPLVGIAFGGGEGRVDQNFAFLLGPSWWIGTTTTGHLQVTLRYQMPLGGEQERPRRRR